MTTNGPPKQFRAVYSYKRDRIRGAGACFVIAVDEDAARAQIAAAMPGVEVTQILEDPEDALAIYERRPRLVNVVRAENLEAKELEQKPPECPNCERYMTAGEVDRGWCNVCEQDRHQDEVDARGHG